MTYDVNYFLNKFSAIPEEQFCLGQFDDDSGRSCYNGHCGLNIKNYLIPEARKEAEALAALLSTVNMTLKDGALRYGDVIFDINAQLNDNRIAAYQQPTPRQRILAALRDIKRMQTVRVPGTIFEEECVLN